MEVVELPLELLNDILSFVGKQAWTEANGLMGKIHGYVQENPPYKKQEPKKKD